MSRASNVALPICGVNTTLLSDFKSSVISGSNSYTSSAAPSISLSFNACTSACSCTIGPREALIKYAVDFIILNCSVSIK